MQRSSSLCLILSCCIINFSSINASAQRFVAREFTPKIISSSKSFSSLSPLPTSPVPFHPVESTARQGQDPNTINKAVFASTLRRQEIANKNMLAAAPTHKNNILPITITAPQQSKTNHSPIPLPPSTVITRRKGLSGATQGKEGKAIVRNQVISPEDWSSETVTYQLNIH